MPEFADPHEPHKHFSLGDGAINRRIVFVEECGENRERSWIVDKPVFVIGAADDCDLQISNSNLAKYHAYVFVRDHVVTLRHLGPAPVITVNGRMTRWGELKHGDLLMLGSAQVRLAMRNDENQAIPDSINTDGSKVVLDRRSRFSFPA